MRPGVRQLLLLAALAPAAAAQTRPATRPAPDLARVFMSAPGPDAERAADELRTVGAAAVDALVAELARSTEARDRRRAAALLRQLAPAERSDQLAALAQDADPEVRLQAARALARRDQAGWRDFQAVRIAGLAALLADPEERIRKEAAEALSWFDDALAATEVARHIARSLSGAAPLETEPLAAEALRRFARQPSARPRLPELVELVERRAPALLPDLIRGMGSRHDPATDELHLSYLSHPDQALRQAAQAAVESLDAWLFRVQDHSSRLALLAKAERFASEPEPFRIRRLHAALLDAKDDRLAGEIVESLLAVPLDPGDADAVLLRAETLCLAAMRQFFTGDARGAHETGDRVLSMLRCVSAQDPMPPRDGMGPGDASVAVRTWAAWRLGVAPPPEEGEIGRYVRQLEAMGGARVRRLRAAMRAEAASALLFAAIAALDPAVRNKGLFEARIDRAVPLLERLDQDWWDEDQLGPCQEWDRCLWSRAGCIDFLTRGLEGRGRNDEAETGFHRMLAALNQKLPAVFAGRPVKAREDVPGLAKGGPAEVAAEPGGRERARSDLLGELARFYERIGENSKAAICHDALIERLSASGLQENRSRWAEALFARAGVALEQRDAEGAKAALQKFLKHFENRRVDVEQRPDFYGNPEQAKAYFQSRLAQGYVSLAVCDNVVLNDTASAREHCKRAYDLDDSPFNRVLYACYLARDGRTEEAIRLAGSVEAIPELCYNLACTYALSGRKEEALAMLKRDLEENHATPKKRNLHRAWARKDRDLVALHGDQRYEALVADEPEGSGR